MTTSNGSYRKQALRLDLVLYILPLIFMIPWSGCGSGTGAGTGESTQNELNSGSVIQEAVVGATLNPMVAEYSVTTSAAATVSVEFGPTTAYGFKTSAQSTAAGGGIANIQVAGMQQDATYHMRAIVNTAAGTVYDSDRTFTTGAFPTQLLLTTKLNVPAGQTPASGIELLSTIGEVVAVDPNGNVIWFYNYQGDDGPWLTKLLPNGHMLMILTLPGFAGNSSIMEVDLAGNVIRQFTVTTLQQKLQNAGYNIQLVSIDHDVEYLPNGHLLFITTDYRVFTDLPGYPGQTTVEGNAIIDVDQSGNPVWVWDAFDHLDINRHPIYFPDWTHCNALAYSASDGNFLLSSRHQSWIMKIDYENGAGTGDILWKLGYQGDFTLLNSTSPADWFYAQHDTKFMSTNTTGNFQLGVFDNGNFRVLDDNGDQCNPNGTPACYSTTTRFDVDETNMTAQREWSYQIPYSFWGGTTQQLPNSDIFFAESAPADLGVLNSRVAEITQGANPKTVWELDIYGRNAYRALHLPSLYPGVQW